MSELVQVQTKMNTIKQNLINTLDLTLQSNQDIILEDIQNISQIQTDVAQIKN